jgi:hypothetical protein
MQDYIEKGVGPDSQLDLRILIIDPICFGAQLRSRGEERAPSRFAGRLKHDVVPPSKHCWGFRRLLV